MVISRQRERTQNPSFYVQAQMKSSKSGSEKNRVLSDHVLTLHQRLVRALSLGIKYHDKKGRKWQCTDVETQGLAVRSMSAFVSCISSDLSRHPLVKDSISDMLVALEGILQSGNMTILSMAAELTAKLVDLLGTSILQYRISVLVLPLSRLLSSNRLPITVPYAIALSRLLSKLTPGRLERHKEVWEAVEKTNAISSIICALQDYDYGIQPVEYFTEMASLLRVILWWWPPARYHIWNNAKLIARLESLCVNPDPSIATAVLQLFSTLALCGIGAMKLLENGETFLPIILHCMQRKQHRHVRLEAFRLIRYLVRSAEACCKIIGSFCEPLASAIIDAMSGWRSLSSEKVPADQVPLVVEACRLALITCWEGEHHSYFWKLGIDRVLLDLILINFNKELSQPLTQCQFEELIAAARKGLYVDGLLIARPYIWNILGSLLTHCGESFSFGIHEDGCYLNVLIACACLVAVDSIHKGHHLSHEGFPNTSEHEPASRAVLLIIFSPCKKIASQARLFLSEVLIQDGKDRLEVILNYLKSVAQDDFKISDSLRIIISLMGLEFYLSIPQYRNFIIRSEVLETLSCLTRRCLSGDIQVRRSSITQHLNDTSNARTCCWVNMDEWEGVDIVLFYSLQAIAELIQYCDFTCNHLETIMSSQTRVKLENSQLQILVDGLQEICNNNALSPGLRWYAAYGLSFLGFYGFPSELGKRIGQALDENELADLQLVLSDGQSVAVHSVVLMVRCPSLLPPKENSFCDRSGKLRDNEQPCSKVRQEVRLSSHVDNRALIKLLGYVYTGFLWADNGLVKQLKMLSRSCNSQSLLKMLYRKRPKWGVIIPSCDFTPALGPAGYPSSDIILKAKATEEMHWSCCSCLLSTPHVHAHKIILWSSCDYLRGLFQSGMQDSHSQSIEVPVCWEALTKLIRWFYSGELPKLSHDCVWNNMDIEEQLKSVQAYVELSLLSEFWLLEDVRKDSINVVLSCLKSNQNLSVEILRFAANLNQLEIVDAAVRYITPLYPQMRDSGVLEVLDEKLRDVIRAAYVHFTQEGHYHSD